MSSRTDVSQCGDVCRGKFVITEVGAIQNVDKGVVLGLKIAECGLIRIVAANEGIFDSVWVKVQTFEDLMNNDISNVFDEQVVQGLSNLLCQYRSLDDASKLAGSAAGTEHETNNSRLHSVHIMRTDTILSVQSRQLRLTIIDCSTPDIYLFEIEYIDKVGDEDINEQNQWTQQKCNLFVFPSDLTEYDRANPLNLKDVTGAFCDTAMEILNGCDAVVACKLNSDCCGEIIDERIRNNVTSTLQSQLGAKYPSNYFTNKHLLLKNGTRIVHDSNSAESKVFAYNLSALDLSQTKFYVQPDSYSKFLQTMGVQTAITIAIEVEGCLWGFYSIQSFQRQLVPTYEQFILLDAAATNSALRLTIVAREDFVSHMSHELRTPLHGIMSALQILQSSKINAEDRSSIIKCALDCSQSMLTNLNEILTIARANGRNSSEQLCVSSFCGLLTSVLDDYNPKANAKSLKSDVLIDLENPMVCDKVTKVKFNALELKEYVLQGGKIQVSKICQNLIDNAIKFTPTEGSINVRVSLAHSCRTCAVWESAVSRYASSYVASQRGLGTSKAPLAVSHNETGWFLVLEVEDTGLGVSKASMQIMFNAFQQLSSGISKTYQGIGLGLHIVRLHTDNFNGMLGVCSTVGQGTLFYCGIPIKCIPTTHTSLTTHKIIVPDLDRHEMAEKVADNLANSPIHVDVDNFQTIDFSANRQINTLMSVNIECSCQSLNPNSSGSNTDYSEFQNASGSNLDFQIISRDKKYCDASTDFDEYEVKKLKLSHGYGTLNTSSKR